MKHLFLFLCLTGIVLIPFAFLQPASVLYFTYQSMDWFSAEGYCMITYTQLAPVKDHSTLLKLSEIVANEGLTYWPIWIGLYYDTNSWRWSFNDISLKSTTLTNWSPGQPDNYKAVESCGGINGTGFWGDYNCVTLKPFICYNAMNTGANRFIGVSSPEMTWSGAQAYCRTSYTDLASALTQTDNDLLEQVASVQGTSWFGLFQDTWKWMDNTLATNIPWGPGQPNNKDGQEYCGVLIENMIDDYPCDGGHYSICELFIPMKRQIISLQVKSDESVLDPAVQSSIIQQIKQKLVEKGMSGDITVTWKVQADGNIFYKKNKDGL